MINSHWKILQCCLFWVGLIRRMWPYSDTNHFTFPLYRNGGPSLAIKVSPARCHCWVPTPQGRCSWCLGCQWAQSSETQLQSEWAWWSKGGTETRGTVKQGCTNEGIWGKRDGSRNETIYDGHGSQIWWTQRRLLFAMITKHDFDSWIVKPATKWKSYTGRISNVHLQSFIEWTPINVCVIDDKMQAMGYIYQAKKSSSLTNPSFAATTH